MELCPEIRENQLTYKDPEKMYLKLFSSHKSRKFIYLVVRTIQIEVDIFFKTL